MINNLYIPFDVSYNLNYIFLLQDLIKDNNDVIMGNSIIESTYGTFPGAIWNGGRTFNNTTEMDLLDIENYITQLNNNNIGFRATFTNSLLTSEHLNNQYCNNILNIMNNGYPYNEVIVASNILEDYLLSNYPNLSLVSSITKGNDFSTFKTAYEKNIYRMIVIYPKKNILDYIRLNIPIQKRNNIEILLNSGCAYCKQSNQHYYIESYNNLYKNNPIPQLICYRSLPNYNKIKFLEQIPEEEKIIFHYDYFHELGLNHYKIQGRGLPFDQFLNDVTSTIFYNPEFYLQLLKKNLN